MSTQKAQKTRHLLDPASVRRYIFGNISTITIENPKTKNYMTYKIKKAKKHSPAFQDLWFVSVLTHDGYQYIGTIRMFAGTKVLTYKPSDRYHHRGSEYIFWLVRNIMDTSRANIYHHGTCSICNRQLTTPQSIEIGIGPVCLKKSN